MFNWRKAMMPPISIIMNTTSISTRCFSANAVTPFILGRARDCGSIYEKAAFGDYLVPKLKSFYYLNHIARRDPRHNLAQLNPFVWAHKPYPGFTALVDNCVARDRQVGVTLAGENRHHGKHLRLE